MQRSYVFATKADVPAGCAIIRKVDGGYIGFKNAGDAINHPTSTGPVSTMETRRVR